ncbi:sigma-70 family RNA polymerase sigma factor [Oceaniradius stylonematis]|uniref:sigma-70 family RNA polymerase sigma factor n=1 Tax=Oceaniradius stylonematis TaxID=2184161 RepID=UPI00273D9029|nr:sigma-70 family RNA polymerase sigma factor [Oceaniradius stylonematis]
MSRENIENLIAAVALRDRKALTHLYALTSAKLFGVCLRVLKDRQDAEDALQEAYIKIWNGAGRYGAGGYSPMSWLIAIARNTAIDKVRARRPDPVDIDEAADLSDDAPGPEATAIAASEGRRIDLCLDELDARRADAVRAAYVEGYSYRELADRHAVPLNTMRTWLRRSLARLKECLER